MEQPRGSWSKDENDQFKINLNSSSPSPLKNVLGMVGTALRNEQSREHRYQANFNDVHIRDYFTRGESIRLGANFASHCKAPFAIRKIFYAWLPVGR